jgi:oxysterol-binding protein 1
MFVVLIYFLLLHRLNEDYEYADLLDKAAQCKDICEQLAYVAVFTISSYSTTSNRTGKPFNPLLGETYECDRTDDLGWRCISEQVSLAIEKENNSTNK